MKTAVPPALAVATLLGACSTPSPDAPVAPRSELAAPMPQAAPAASDPPASPPRTHVVAGPDACASDADCVPSTCCHASACVARSHAPVCEGVLCTESCQGGTIDCGGGCSCDSGRCAARVVDRR